MVIEKLNIALRRGDNRPGEYSAFLQRSVGIAGGDYFGTGDTPIEASIALLKTLQANDERPTMNVNRPDKADCVGEWVNLTERQLGDKEAVVAELDVDMADTVSELVDDVDVIEYIVSVEPDFDGPYDLLWFERGRYGILPRVGWRPKAQMGGERHDEELANTLEPADHTWPGGNVEWRTYTCTECDQKLHHDTRETPEPKRCPYCPEE